MSDASPRGYGRGQQGRDCVEVEARTAPCHEERQQKFRHRVDAAVVVCGSSLSTASIFSLK